MSSEILGKLNTAEMKPVGVELQAVALVSIPTTHQPLYLDNDDNLSSLDNVVLAPMREDAFESVQPLDCAWTNVETDVKSLVPAPRLELGTP